MSNTCWPVPLAQERLNIKAKRYLKEQMNHRCRKDVIECGRLAGQQYSFDVLSQFRAKRTENFTSSFSEEGIAAQDAGQARLRGPKRKSLPHRLDKENSAGNLHLILWPSGIQAVISLSIRLDLKEHSASHWTSTCLSHVRWPVRGMRAPSLQAIAS